MYIYWDFFVIPSTLLRALSCNEKWVENEAILFAKEGQGKQSVTNEYKWTLIVGNEPYAVWKCYKRTRDEKNYKHQRNKK